MFQLSLLQETTIKKSIKNVPINQLSVSEFNPRYSRNDEDINHLAQRISRNGFEITRALWVYQNGNGYKVFAGGTRLEAAKRAGCKTLPVVLHEGLAEDDIVKLAEQDNENDEYHAKVSPVDNWANYAWLKESKGWTQERIAEAKGKAQSLISDGIKLDEFSKEFPKIGSFITEGKIKEYDLRHIIGLSLNDNLADWLTRKQAWFELADKAVTDKRNNGSKSSESIKGNIDQWREFIEYAGKVYNSLSESITLYGFESSPPQPYRFDSRGAFVSELKRIQARSLVKVKSAEQMVKSLIAENLRHYQFYIEKQSTEAAQEAMQAEQESNLLSRFVLGDCLEILDNRTLGEIRLLLLDPPYGKNYQSNRRWASKSPEKVTGDKPQEAMDLLRKTIKKALKWLGGDAHILVFCDWEGEPEVRQILTDFDLRLKGSLIWVKEEHSAGDLRGTFGPSHERIVHAVKGSPEVSPRIRDVLEFNRSRETNHPTEKPVPLLQALINSTTNEGDLVVDLFAGCASTLIAAMRLGRDFFGVEIESNYHEEGSARLLKEKCTDEVRP